MVKTCALRAVRDTTESIHLELTWALLLAHSFNTCALHALFSDMSHADVRAPSQVLPGQPHRRGLPLRAPRCGGQVVAGAWQ